MTGIPHLRRPASPRPSLRTVLRIGALLFVAACKGTLGDLPTPALVEISPFSAEVVIGATTTLYASVLDGNGRVITGAGAVTWTSSAPSVATVDAGGKVTGVTAGQVRITARIGGAVGAAAVRVRQPSPSRIDVPPPSAALARGDTVRIVARALDGAGGLYAGRAFDWQSSDPSVATVAPSADSTSALLTAVAPGTTTITATNLGTTGTLGVTVSDDAVLEFAPSSAQLFATQGSATPGTADIQIRNAGGGSLRGLSVASIAYALPSATGWLQATLGGTTSAPTLSLRAASGALPAGNYRATVTVASTAPAVLPRTLDVTLSVTPPPAIAVAASSVSFVAALAGAPPPAQTVAVTNVGGGTLAGLAVSAPVAPNGQPATWLTATLSSTVAPATLQLSVNQGALPIGTYDATVSLTAPNAVGSPRAIAVRLRVDRNAQISLSPGSLTLTTALGTSPAASTIAVTNGGGGTLTGLSVGTVTYDAGATGWLAATIDQSAAPATITVTPRSASLAVGTYTATFPVNSSVQGVAPAIVTVTIDVRQPAVIVASVTRITLVATATARDPSTVVGITNSGSGALTGLTARVDYFAGQPTGWLSATFASGNTAAPTSLILQSTSSSIDAGTYSATVTVASPNAANPVVLTVSFEVSGRIAASTATSSLFLPLGAATTSPIAVAVTNGGAGQLRGLAASVAYQSGSGWLNASLGSTSAPTTLTLQAQADAVSVRGTSVATVTITGTNVAPVTVTVSRQVGYTYERHIVSVSTNVFVSMGCTGCHNSSPVINFSSYATLTAARSPNPYINTASTNVFNSYLYRKIADPSLSHSGGKFTSNPLLPVIVGWIQDGARER